jgi:hypothetical protein
MGNNSESISTAKALFNTKQTNHWCMEINSDQLKSAATTQAAIFQATPILRIVYLGNLSHAS